MARQFRYTLDRRIINRTLVSMLRIGIAPKMYYLLTVKGRRTGNPHSIPVVLVGDENHQWLVAPYGEVDWVKNARASSVVRLSRGKQIQNFRIHELSAERSAPILKEYLIRYPLTAPYFDAREGSSIEQFVEEAKSKPVFELTEISDEGI